MPADVEIPAPVNATACLLSRRAWAMAIAFATSRCTRAEGVSSKGQGASSRCHAMYELWLGVCLLRGGVFGVVCHTFAFALLLLCLWFQPLLAFLSIYFLGNVGGAVEKFGSVAGLVHGIHPSLTSPPCLLLEPIPALEMKPGRAVLGPGHDARTGLALLGRGVATCTHAPFFSRDVTPTAATRPEHLGRHVDRALRGVRLWSCGLCVWLFDSAVCDCWCLGFPVDCAFDGCVEPSLVGINPDQQ
eukprot:m.196164 g.196164  ORF g.196164 m.196164 type:complete len:245 (-) comp18320_c0_seq4:89-823(-)